MSSNLGTFTKSVSENWGGGMLFAGSEDKDRDSVNDSVGVVAFDQVCL